MADPKIKVVAELDDKVSSGMKKMGQNVKQGAQGATQSFGNLKTAAVGLGTAFAGLAVIKKATAYLSEASAVAEEAMMIDARLAATIKVTYQEAGNAARHFQDMASSLQEVSIFGDEAIKTAQQQLILFREIGQDVMPEVTAAVVDVASATGKMGMATKTLGRAMADPIKGLTQLEAISVFFTKAQKEQVKQMVASNDVLGAQQVILGEVKRRYDGMAESIAATPIGKLQQQKEILSDIKEASGRNMIPAVIAWHKALNGVLTVMNQIFFMHKVTKNEAQYEAQKAQIAALKIEYEELSASIATAEKEGADRVVTIGVENSSVMSLNGALAAQKLILEDIAALEAKTQGQKVIAPVAPDIDGGGGDGAGAAVEESVPFALPSDAALDEGISNLQEAREFNIQVQQEIRAMTQTERENDLMELQEWYAAKLNEAEKFGADKTAIDELYAAKTVDINKKHDNQLLRSKTNMNMAIASSTANLFGTLSTLARQGAAENKEMAGLAKGLAIAQATINTALGITAAMKDAPYPLNIVLAAITAATGAAQIAIIASQSFQQGGIVAGNKVPADTVPANLTGGEMVLTEQQQARLFNMANTGGDGGGVTADFSITINGNADADTVEAISETREAQLEEFKGMYEELTYRRQL